MSEPIPTDLNAIMQAKLVYSQEVVSGIGTKDFDRIVRNAENLKQLSFEAEWLVHDTRTYITFSEAFRDAADRIANAARLKEIDTVTAQYESMLNTCVQCHDYLQHERMLNDMPGDISLNRHRLKDGIASFVP